MKVRLQKIIAGAGVTSRRKAEALISEGRVRVGGQVIGSRGVKADPARDIIEVDGRPLVPSEKKIYIALYKPRGVISSCNDPQGRRTVRDLICTLPVRVFPVGRLDYDAEGLLLLTNDGEFAERVLHPRFGVPRTYLVKVKGVPRPEQIMMLRDGVPLSDGRSYPAKVSLLERTTRNAWLRMTVKEGRNRLIKRMLEAVGHPVLKLKRTAFGRIRLGDLGPGDFRLLSPAEVIKLRGKEPATAGREGRERPLRP